MNSGLELSCTCGKVRLALQGAPLIAAECHCNSCRKAGATLANRTGRQLLEGNGGTRYVLYRKDKVRFLSGQDLLREYRLSPAAPTRRVVATCCGTPIFVEFHNGHWLSLYAELWPAAQRPVPDLRTQTADRPTDAPPLPPDIPAGWQHTALFYAKLLGAWIAMGFKIPRVPVAGPLDI